MKNIAFKGDSWICSIVNLNDLKKNRTIRFSGDGGDFTLEFGRAGKKGNWVGWKLTFHPRKTENFEARKEKARHP